MYAAQFSAAIRRSHPRFDDEIRSGHLTPIFDWLKTHIWSQASRYDGEPLNPVHFRAHLEGRSLS